MSHQHVLHITQIAITSCVYIIRLSISEHYLHLHTSVYCSSIEIKLAFILYLILICLLEIK